MTRKEKIFAHLNPNGIGIEIGASFNPIAPKSEGFKVHVIDHLNQEDLIAKYKDQGINTDNIEAVDFVWNGEALDELTQQKNYYDWIIASHVIEHIPDFIGFLNNCAAVLKENGVISLVVPDKRFCFDHFRPITGISKIIDSHLQKNILHSPGTVVEQTLNAVHRGGAIAWDKETTSEYIIKNKFNIALKKMNKVINEHKYIDSHAWCFVPSSFRLMIHDLFMLMFIPFQELAYFPTDGCEFYISLSRNGSGISMSRLEMMQHIEMELKE